MEQEPKSWLAEEAELQAVLASDLFARAPSLALLLEYICRKRFAGEDHLIKEYNIAVEALGRPADFDQKRDSIVRVEAHRLRKRLKHYYQNEGASHEVEIEIPARGYSPLFRYRGAEPVVPAVEPDPEYEFLDDPSSSNPVLPAVIDLRPVAPPTIQPKRPSAWRLVAVIALMGAIAAAVAWTRSSSSAGTNAAAVSSASASTDSMSEVRIDCGASKEYVDKEGHPWLADAFFSGGSAVQSSDAETVAEGTMDMDLLKTWRQGDFAYKIPLKTGVYELTLLFAEPHPQGEAARPEATSRLFDVLINGQPVLVEFDLFTDVGQAGVPVWRVYKNIRPDEKGFLNLEFRNRVGGAIISAISVTPGNEGRLRPIRITARERPYTDATGRFWQEDRYFNGGKLVKRIEHISGTDDPEIYRGERYGRFRYVIPVTPDGTYTLVLHFAETWWGGTGKGGEGSRLFEVLCNGRALLSGFDVYREAGGPFHAITRTFRGIKPRDTGKITLDFVPSRNYAFINAIEVLDEGGDPQQAGPSGSH